MSDTCTSYDSVCHSGKCTYCHLCLKLNAKMKHLKQLQTQAQFKEVYAWLKRHKPELEHAACLCLSCLNKFSGITTKCSLLDGCPNLMYFQNYAMSSIVKAQYTQVAPSVRQAAVQGYVPVERKREIMVLAVVDIFVTTVHGPGERHA